MSNPLNSQNSQNSQNTQDWNHVVLTKTKSKTQTKKTNITYTQAKLRVDEDGIEYKKVYKLNSDEIKEYTKYRVDLKLTRVDLAKKLCCSQIDIDCLETGKISSSHIGGKYKTYLKREYSKLQTQPI